MRITQVAALLTLAAGFGHAAQDDRAPKQALEHYRAGQSALQTERFEDAEQEFRAAIRLDSLLVAAHYGLGQTMMATKRYPDAVLAYTAARQAFARSQELAASNEMATQRRLDDQIKALQDDNNAARRNASGGPNAASVQNAIIRNEEQIRTLQTMRKRGGEEPLPTPHWLSFALGSAYFRANDLTSAEREYRAALAQKADLGEGHLNLGVVCMLTGRLDEAQSEIALAEKAGIRVPQALKDDIQKRRGAQP